MGTKSLSYRKALLLATLATAAGSLLSLVLAQGLVRQFSGKGLLPQGMVEAPHFLISVGLGAALTVIIAARAGLPISTPQALIGGLVGAGLAASPGQLQLAKLGHVFLLPLLLSSLLAAGLGLLTYKLLRLRPAKADCACLSVEMSMGVTTASLEAAPRLQLATIPRLVIASTSDCNKPGTLKASAPIRLSIPRLLDQLHVFSASLIPAVLVLTASQFALPLPTTYVSVGALGTVGVGGNSLNGGAQRTILLSWLATLPIACCLAWLAFMLLGQF